MSNDYRLLLDVIDVLFEQADKNILFKFTSLLDKKFKKMAGEYIEFLITYNQKEESYEECSKEVYINYIKQLPQIRQ